MSIARTNKLLQTSVEYQLQEMLGAVAQDRNSRSYDIDSAVVSTVTFGYGNAVVLGANKGAVAVASGDTVGEILGFIKYQNAGIIDNSGYPVSLYTNLPVLKQGVIYLASSGTIDLDATLGLCIDSTKAAYQKVVDITGGTPAGCIDISSIAKVYQKAANSVVAVDVQIL